MATRRHTPAPGEGGVGSSPTVGDEPTYLVTVLGVRHPIAFSGTREDRIASIAGLQRGRISRTQLLAAGIADRTIYHLAADGLLRRVHRSVYAVGHTAPAPLAPETAALLACGEHAVLSHGTAARLLKLVPDGGTAIHVTIRGRHGPQPTGVRVHRTNRLNRAEVRTVDRLPTTSAARTLFDLAAGVDLWTLERAIEEALLQKLVSERQLRTLASSATGNRGVRRVRTILGQNREPGITRSKAEQRYRALIRAAQLPEPLTNVRVHGFEVDVYWPDLGVVVEIQSQKFHSTRAALERDTRKAATLTAAGLTVSYVTWTQMEHEPFAVVGRTAQLLARAGV